MKNNDLKWNLSKIGLRADLILKKKRDQQMRRQKNKSYPELSTQRKEKTGEKMNWA